MLTMSYKHPEQVYWQVELNTSPFFPPVFDSSVWQSELFLCQLMSSTPSGYWETGPGNYTVDLPLGSVHSNLRSCRVIGGVQLGRVEKMSN